MYLYFNEDGELLELINDQALRKGSSDFNKIYVYWEGNYETIARATIRYQMPDESEVSAEFLVSTALTTKQIPYDKKRKLKYFENHKDYEFITLTPPDQVFYQNGLVCATLKLFINQGGVLPVERPLGIITFTVENAVTGYTGDIAIDNIITESQWNYLLKILASGSGDPHDLRIYYTDNDGKLALKLGAELLGEKQEVTPQATTDKRGGIKAGRSWTGTANNPVEIDPATGKAYVVGDGSGGQLAPASENVLGGMKTGYTGEELPIQLNNENRAFALIDHIQLTAGSTSGTLSDTDYAKLSNKNVYILLDGKKFNFGAEISAGKYIYINCIGYGEGAITINSDKTWVFDEYLSYWVGTKAQYDAIPEKEDRMYIITDDNGSLEELVEEIKNQVLSSLYPVGSIIYCDGSFDPNVQFTDTTWDEIAQGRMLIGVGSIGTGHPTFTLGDIGGYENAVAVNHGHGNTFTILSDGEHRHNADGSNGAIVRKDAYSSYNSLGTLSTGGFAITGDGASGPYGSTLRTTTGYAGNHTHILSGAVSDYTGETGENRNLPPYLAVKIWKRIA